MGSVTVPPTPTHRADPWSPGGRAPSRGRAWGEALLVGAAATLFSLAERGYSGARWSDAPIIKSFADPRLYRNDPFVWSLHDGTPAAYTYQLMALVARALPMLTLDQALFLLYLPATVAALALLYRLGLALVGRRDATLLFLVLYVAGYRLVTVGSAILHSAEATPQTLALPLQLGSLYALVRQRLALAGLLMGLALNLHAPTTVYLAAALALYEVLSFRRLGLGAVTRSVGLLALAGAPMLVGSLLHHTDQLPLWALSLARAELATDISLATHFTTRPLLLYNLLGLALAALAWRRAPAGEGRRLTLLFLAAVGLMCLGALLFFDLSLRTPFSTLVARLQLPRSAWLLDLFGLLYLAYYLAVGWDRGEPSRPLALLLLAGMLAAEPDFTPLDPLLSSAIALTLLGALVPSRTLRRLQWWAPWVLAPLAVGLGLRGVELREFDFALSVRSGAVFGGLVLGWGLSALLRRRAGRSVRAALPGVAMGLLSVILVQRVDSWLYVNAHRGGLQAAAQFQEWARTQTPVDSVFLILPSEPNNATFYKNAERALFLVRERANQAVYFREHNFEFERRVRALGVSQPLRYREELDQAYRRLTEDRVRELARDFGVTYFVPARDGNFSFPIVYQSGGWTVYEVR